MEKMINQQKTQGVQADHIMFRTLVATFFITIGIAAFTGTWAEAFFVGIPALLVPAALIFLNPGSLSSRLSVAAGFMVFSALQIQQTHGSIEAHFIIFTLLAFLLFYRDWRPILVAAAIIAVHHVLFNFLQQAGDGFYVFASGPSINTVIVHALFVVFESAGLIYMAVQLRTEMTLFGGMPHDVATAVRQVAEGDLRIAIQVREGDTASVIAATADMVKKLTVIIRDIRSATDSINIASNEIAQGNSDLSQRTEEQASSLEETASSMEELTSTVKQNAENAKHANELAQSAFEVAAQGGQSVNNVVATMASISDSSKKIGDIIGVIEGIAFQTNILALNAAVEAARAGEQGRGFAVVAMEVRNLAQRSSVAAKEIKGLIGDSVEKVVLGSKQVDQAGAKMGEIVTAVERVTELMAEIAAASKEQSLGIEEVNQAIVRMDDVTQQNAALVEEAAASSESMREQTELLLKAVGSFRLSDDSQKEETTPKLSEKPDISQRKVPAIILKAGRNATVKHSLAEKNLRINSKIHSKRSRLNPGVADLGAKTPEDDGDWKEF